MRLVDPATVWHSRPTIAAVLAAEEMRVGHGLAMLSAIQRAHYVEGCRVVEAEVLTAVGVAIGLDADGFARTWSRVAVDRHIQRTRRLMDDHRLQGFPAFLVQSGEAYARLPHETVCGQPDAFVAALAGCAVVGA